MPFSTSTIADQNQRVLADATSEDRPDNASLLSRQANGSLLTTGDLWNALMPGQQRSQALVSSAPLEGTSPNSSPAPSLAQSEVSLSGTESMGNTITNIASPPQAVSASNPAPPLGQSDVSFLTDSMVEALEETVTTFSVSSEATNPNAPPSASPPPSARTTNAKDDLHKYYDQIEDKCLLKKSKNFVSWNDGDQDHIPFWTSYFVAPEGICFPAGHLIDCDKAMYKEVDGLHWYGTKAEAMRAAAGRAIDSFLFRDRGLSRSSRRHCYELPEWPVPRNLPEDHPHAVDEIEDLLQRLT